MSRAGLGLLVLLTACAHGKGKPSRMDVEAGDAPHLRPKVGFRPDVETRLNALMDAKGKGTTDYDPIHRPVAVFDWDNTMMKNDIGDATLFFAIQHNALKAPPGGQWRRASALLTDEAVEALTQACPVQPGEQVPTDKVACADTLVALYTTGKVPKTKAPAFTVETAKTMHSAYAFAAQLFQGSTGDEVREMTRQALAAGEATYESDKADLSKAVYPVGSTEQTAYVHIYEAMHNLVSTLQVRGFDVWIVSASMQEEAEVVAAEVGIDPDHVVGVRLGDDAQGRKTTDIADCGGLGAGRVIPYDQGKRCWVNKAIFGLAEDKQMNAQTEPGVRPALAVGDSDTDVAMVDDAYAMHLVIHRHEKRLTCHALLNTDKRWALQPMFIGPLAYQTAPFPCHEVTGPSDEPMEDMMDAMLDGRDDAVPPKKR